MLEKEKRPKKRDQALNDATHGQFGEEPRPEPFPDGKDVHDNDGRKAARKRSKSL